MFNQKSAILILPHLMTQEGELSSESKSRCKKAIEIYNSGHFEYLITSGWDYRADSNLKICDAMAEFLINKYSIRSNKIIRDGFSRDTVGDAFFIKRNVVNKHNILNLTVITSDYHVNRAEYIFRKFFSKTPTQINFKASKTKLLLCGSIQAHEENSINKFKETFEDTNFEDTNEVLEALTTRHSFYNGECKQKLVL